MKRINFKNNYCVYMHTNKLNGKRYIGRHTISKKDGGVKEKIILLVLSFLTLLKSMGGTTLTI